MMCAKQYMLTKSGVQPRVVLQYHNWSPTKQQITGNFLPALKRKGCKKPAPIIKDIELHDQFIYKLSPAKSIDYCSK